MTSTPTAGPFIASARCSFPLRLLNVSVVCVPTALLFFSKMLIQSVSCTVQHDICSDRCSVNSLDYWRILNRSFECSRKTTLIGLLENKRFIEDELHW